MKSKAIAFGIMFALVIVGIAGIASAEKKEAKKSADHLYLYEKDPDTWEIVEDGAWGKMKYYPEDEEFNFVFNGHGLEGKEDYTLIVYPDPWPGKGLIVLGDDISCKNGNVHIKGSVDTGDLDDAKIWLILTADYSAGMEKMTGWHPTEYLFEHNLIDFTDIDN